MAIAAGSKVLIVGGSSGIGLATAKGAAAAGAKVTVAGRSQAKIDAALKAIGHGAVGRKLDATNNSEVEAFFADGTTWDHVVVSAGLGGRGRLPEQEIAVAQAAMDGKFWVCYRVARSAKIAKGGSLTFVSGQLGHKPSPATSVIGAICAAIEGLGRGLAIDYAPTRVNTVSPGVVASPHWERMSAADREKMYKEVAAELPVGRVGTPEDVGAAVVMLMGNGFMTGTTVHVEGGSLVA